MSKSVISAALILFFFSSVSFSQIAVKETRLVNDLRRDHGVSTGWLLQKETNLFSDDTLPKLKEDFRVNDLGGDYGADQLSACSAADSSGSCGIIWIDYRNAKKDLYAQFYDRFNRKIGSNFKVNSSNISGNNSAFIASNKKGNFVAAWMIDMSYIAAQRLSEDGRKEGENILVNSISGVNTLGPSVAVNEDGSFIIVWASESGAGIYQVYIKLFNKDGNPLTAEINVSDYTNMSSFIGQARSAAADGAGNYMVTWSSNLNGSFSQIFAQKINSRGEKVGVNIWVSIPGDSTQNYAPEIVSTDDGHFFIIWGNNSKNYGSTILGRIYYSDHFLNDKIIIPSNNYCCYSYTVSSDRDGIFLILNSGVYPPFFQKISKSGASIGNPVNLNFNPYTYYYNYRLSLTDIYKNNFFVPLNFYQRNDPGVFLQKYKSDLTPAEELLKVNDDNGSAFQENPLVHFNDKGSSIILWQDRRNGWDDLYSQVYDKDFNPVGGNIQVNDPHPGYWNLNDKVVRHLSDGSFIIAFSGSDSLGYGIYLQHISSTGEKIVNSILIKEDFYSSKVVLSINKQDQILLCWFDEYYAYLRKYSSQLIPLNEEKNFIKDISRKQQFGLSIDPEFNILTAWINYNPETQINDNKIYGVFYNENGDQEGTPFIITDNVSYNYPGSLCLSNDKKDYIIMWGGYGRLYVKRFYSSDNYSTLNSLRTYIYSLKLKPEVINFENHKAFIKINDGQNVYGYLFNDNKQKVDSFFLHSYNFLNPEYDSYYTSATSADLFENKLAFAYENSDFRATGLDIWADIQQADKINFKKEGLFHPANYDLLYANYPNPFNSTTKISYQLFAFHKVKLSVFDILGREVKVLVDQYQEKGAYEIDFDASGLPSGIYFYRLQAFDTAVKKMIHIK